MPETCRRHGFHPWIGKIPWSRKWLISPVFLPGKPHEQRILASYIQSATTKSHQLCPTLCDPIDGRPPGSPIPGILQARVLEWVAISFSNALKWKVKVKSLSHARLLATPWTAAYQAPSSMGFSRQEYWSGVPLPSLAKVLINFYFGRKCLYLLWEHILKCFVNVLVPNSMKIL